MKKLFLLLMSVVCMAGSVHAQTIYEGELQTKDGSLFVVDKEKKSVVLIYVNSSNSWSDADFEEVLKAHRTNKVVREYVQKVIPDGVTELSSNVIDAISNYPYVVIHIPSTVKRIASDAFAAVKGKSYVYFKMYPTGQPPVITDK